MNKRGQGLPMNTIIMAIIVIVVLIAIIVFFMGGFKNVVTAISGIWGAKTSGVDQSFALQECDNLCSQAQSMNENIRVKSLYCKKTFNIDMNGDGDVKNIAADSTKNIEEVTEIGIKCTDTVLMGTNGCSYVKC